MKREKKRRRGENWKTKRWKKVSENNNGKRRKREREKQK